jgi:hypothetical protein
LEGIGAEVVKTAFVMFQQLSGKTGKPQKTFE